jgi:putative membrane protein insertion efficiency factor
MVIPDTPTEDPALRSLKLSLGSMPRLPFLAALRLYQLTLSRFVPPDTCRFWPTCSHYAYQAVYKYGVWKGGRLSFGRLLRCQPFAKGGYDPVP